MRRGRGQDSVWRDILRNHAAGADDGALANAKLPACAASHDDMRPDERFLLNGHLTRAACVCDNDRSNADLDAILNFNLFGKFTIDVNIVPDKNIFPNPNTARSVEERPQGGCAGTEASDKTQSAVKTASEKRLLQLAWGWVDCSFRRTNSANL